MSTNLHKLGIADVIYAPASRQPDSTQLGWNSALINRRLIINILNATVRTFNPERPEPWVVVVIQDEGILQRLCERAMIFVQSDSNETQAMIAICGSSAQQHISNDCWHTARNLIVAASATGLDASFRPQLVPIMNTLEWKQELEIGADIDVFVLVLICAQNPDLRESNDHAVKKKF